MLCACVQIWGQGRKKRKGGGEGREERKETLSSPFTSVFSFFSFFFNLSQFPCVHTAKTAQTPTEMLDTQASNLNGHTLGFRSDSKLQANIRHLMLVAVKSIKFITTTYAADT